MPRTRRTPTPRQLSDRTVRLILIVAALAIRLPLVSRFNFITYDGTYYASQAKALLHGELSGGSFPIGYPLLIAPVLAITRDGALSGAFVSLLAAIGSVLVLYELGKQFMGRTNAAIGAIVLAIMPLFIQVSMEVLSESTYIFWLLLALMYFGRSRYMKAGLAIGAAAATRPEAVAVAGLLGLVMLARWARRNVAPRKLLVYAAGFVIVYSVAVAAMSAQRGGLMLLSRSHMYGTKSTPWMLREASVDYQGKSVAEARVRERIKPVDRVTDYLTQTPRDIGRLCSQVMWLLPLFALAGISRRPSFVLTAFFPILIIPLFTEDRGILRWVLPYAPPLILYGMIGLESVTPRRLVPPARAAVIACAVLALVVHRDVTTGGLEREMIPVREVARRFAPRVSPGDEIADRKPYFAFYAGGRYVEIPVAPYDDAIAALARSGVRYLSLFQPAIHNLRPAMRPLLYDRASILGELRYRQVLLDRSGEFVYEHALDADPLVEQPIVTHPASTEGVGDLLPAWSPDGSRLAFRRSRKGNPRGEICVLDLTADSVRTLVETADMADFITWSPDGRRVAYSDIRDGNQDILAVDVATGRVTPLVRNPARDYAPSWCPATGELFFGSDRSGTPGIWVQPGTGGEAKRVFASAPVGRPGVSPSGSLVAWTDEAGRLVLHDRRTDRTVTVAEPRGVITAPSWSPDEGTIAIAALDWGSANIYLVNVSDGRALRMTKRFAGMTMPAWRPDGSELAAAAVGKGKDLSIFRLSGLAPYLERLAAPTEFTALRRPESTRGQPAAAH